ncbi:MAG TPA: fumarylacetoacetate hydrolase family protein [Gemmatimonadales bacterium]|nr:fumarylacetoacetate hydrolase family protein [Gemmatimonadales bacterium]
MRRPGKIVCVGRNYVDHAKELGNEVPKEPLLFLKPPSSVIFDGEPIVLPDMSRRVEHEGEIGVLIGTRLRQGDEAAARAAVAGITCVNDVTARDLQKSDGQWTRAKGFDTFCPMGPVLKPVDAGFNFSSLEVVCRVNGVERQRGRAADMVFGIPVLLAFISRVMTLEPGDLVATGTPAGIGPLVDGDLVEVEIPGVGVLHNPVRAR